VSESTERTDAGAVFGALSDPTRRALLEAIASSSATTATQLAAELPISRQAVVKHLAALSDAGLLERERAGRDVRYHLTPAPLSEAVSWIAAVGGQWDERLRTLERSFGEVRGPMSPPERRPTPDTGKGTG
jgi:DNA-binding transcriptional ArsR family regulator